MDFLQAKIYDQIFKVRLQRHVTPTWLFHSHGQLSLSHLNMHTVHLLSSCLQVEVTLAPT